MCSEKVFLFFFTIVIVADYSLQDGFNFYKALNRTPVDRVESYFRDGLVSTRYKVPMAKKNAYDVVMNEYVDRVRETQAKEMLDLLWGWYSKTEPNEPARKKKSYPECGGDTRNPWFDD